MPTYNQLSKGARSTARRKLTALRGCPQRKGTCLRVYTTKPKKPNSAIRKIAKVRLTTGRNTLVYIPGFGHNLSEHSVVLIRGGRVRDVPGMHYKMLRNKFDFTASESYLRNSARSKYGIKEFKKELRKR
jgi:small subunit ribosomal protein S12